jgi:hypothetical protein
VVEDWLIEAPWFIVEDEPMSVELWFALTLLDTDWSPLCPSRPMLTPGLTFAPDLIAPVSVVDKSSREIHQVVAPVIGVLVQSI